jgi:hypothetical protein
MIDEEGVSELMGKIVSNDAGGAIDISDLPACLDENLIYFLSKCRAGYSQDNYFHFFGAGRNDSHNIKTWNSHELWKHAYGKLVSEYFFFAEDIFGNQFGYRIDDPSGNVFMFWVDDGRVESFADDFWEFVEFTIFDFEIFGKMRKLADDFQHSTPLERKSLHHLSYKVPILLGGNAGDIGNLEIIESVANLTFLGQLVSQCQAFPPGTKIKDVEINKQSQTIKFVPDFR